jgi:hypothetical protein
VDRRRDVRVHLLSAGSAQRLRKADMDPTMEMARGTRSTSREEMVIERLRSLPQDKQQMVPVPALASVHATGVANLVDVL